jgi:hypothetical protein
VWNFKKKGKMPRTGCHLGVGMGSSAGHGKAEFLNWACGKETP